MPANYYMPGNVVNPSNDPIVNERLRGLLDAGVDDVSTPGAGSNFGKGLLSGVLGLPGDAMSLLSEIPARLPGPQQGAAERVRGLLGNITSDGLAERMGADLSRPVTQAGLIGAPDPKDVGKGLMAAASGVGYRIQHTAPIREGLNTLDDATDIFGDDIYNPSVSWNYFGHGGNDVGIDKQSARIIAGFRGMPEKEITIYRAVPKGVDEINPGDWVTVNKNYANQHGYAHVGDDYQVISKKVKAKDIATDGNSIHEWGYDPQLKGE